MLILFYLSSGLFLGWSLGANDAANVFGTAVSTKMLRFRTAAIIASIFVILGAVSMGGGASATLGKLGSVDMMAGAFVVALSAGFVVFTMVRLGLPVSTSQAVVGAIIGWNLFSGTLVDYNALVKIVGSWVAGPFLATLFSIILYFLFQKITEKVHIHIFRIDLYTRLGLILVGAFGAYSLGANNIANVMGVFVPVSPFRSIDVFGLFVLTGVHQLFLLGGLAIAVGILTYSERVMETVGTRIVKLTPQAALVVVLSHSVVLFIFASQGLHDWMRSVGLPGIPLVPISSSQLVIGAVVGIGMVHGGRNIHFGTLARIGLGWIYTPVAAALITFLALFFMQNVFDQPVHRQVPYEFSQDVRDRLAQVGIMLPEPVWKHQYENGVECKMALARETSLRPGEIEMVMAYGRVEILTVADSARFRHAVEKDLTPEQIAAVLSLKGQVFRHRWQVGEALAAISRAWRGEGTENTIRQLKQDLDLVCEVLHRQMNAPVGRPS
ncbi:MAG: inorganic phosphate transporter family protein [Candidatus Marinimicrobia bacterium]|nr:inorganic phosphate transporter family protein [Candidatus Neomarinimicrobiota bacterium]MCF7901827.1 inorganic phosphate transporter family protein [Candidatus Neomarinimicrobiota bacterium]